MNQIKRNVCCLDIENGGGMSMVNLDSYIDSGRIKFLYVLLMDQLKVGMPLENIGWVGLIWNLVKPVLFYKCSNISSLNLNRYQLFLSKINQSMDKIFTIC